MNKAIFKILRYSGLPWFFRKFIQRDKVSILMFHEISKETAEQSFSYLRKKYNIISLNDYLQAIINKGKSKLPKKALVITFDDGHSSNYQILPVIKKYKIPLTIFLCSSIINTNRHYWYKYDKISKPIQGLKKLSNKERLKSLAEDGFEQDKEYNHPQALSKAQILEMAEHVNMQAHTMFHPCLPNCDYEEAKAEIAESKTMLEDEYGFNINALAYPNGDYSDRDVEFARQAGYACAVTVDHGFNTLESDLFRLKRLSANDTTNINELIVKSSGLWGYIKGIV